MLLYIMEIRTYITHTFAATHKGETKLITATKQRATNVARYASVPNSHFPQLAEVKILQEGFIVVHRSCVRRANKFR